MNYPSRMHQVVAEASALAEWYRRHRPQARYLYLYPQDVSALRIFPLAAQAIGVELRGEELWIAGYEVRACS